MTQQGQAMAGVRIQAEQQPGNQSSTRQSRDHETRAPETVDCKEATENRRVHPWSTAYSPMKGRGQLWGDEAQSRQAELLSTGVRLQGKIQMP